jgi:hypothetical protein
MPKFRKNFTDRHLDALRAVQRLINATPQAIAYSQNMPKRADYWRNYLNDMRDAGWLTAKQIHTTSRTGRTGQRLGTLYALTKEGAAVIADTDGIDLADVHYPHSGIHATSPFQFPHRADFIELLAVFLGFEKASEGNFEILDIVPYYRHDGANRLGTGRAVARVEVAGDFASPVLIPDALMRFRAGDIVRLAAIEYHRETDTRAIIEQLRKHAAAIDAGVFPAMYDHHATNHVLSIHAHADKLKNVRERIEGGEFPDFERYTQGYHFAAAADIYSLGLTEAFYTLEKKKTGIFSV